MQNRNLFREYETKNLENKLDKGVDFSDST